MEVCTNMQNSFKKTIKKVAAIGTGIAMLGMTLSGALAADLSNYPGGLGLKNDANTILVVGASAGDSASDNGAATDIAAGLPAGAKSSGGVLQTGEKQEDIPIGQGITNQTGIGFDRSLEDDDITVLQDKQIAFISSDYDIREVIAIGSGAPSIETSLTSGDDDYKSDIVMEPGTRSSIQYIYAFDDAINVSKATTSNPLTLKFLGKTLKIVNTDSTTPNTKFTAYVGNEYFLNSGESVVVNGKKITLDNVGSTGSIALDVDGVKEVISSGNTETVNGIEIINDDTDNPQKAGDCLSLPNNYVSICMDSLTVQDDDYLELIMEYQSSADLSQAGGEWATLSGEPAIYIHTNDDDTLELVDGDSDFVDNLTANVKTKEIYLVSNGSSAVDVGGLNTTMIAVFYKNKDDNRFKFAGTTNGSKGGERFARIKYKDTKDANIELDFGNQGGVTSGPAGNGSNINITLDIVGDSSTELTDGYDDITTQWGRGTTLNNKFAKLGNTVSSEEAAELVWNGTGIGSKDEDHRTKYGIIIKNPKSESSSDKVVLKIPSDQVQANVVIKGAAVSGSDSTTGGAAIMTDSQVTDLTAQNVIAVGGPCANTVSATLLVAESTWPTCADGFTAGNAVIELKQNGAKWAVVAAGYSADDTRRAGIVLKNAATKLSGVNKMSATVSGTTLEVSGITVA